MQHKLAATSVKIHDIIQARWSPRAFDAQKTVSHADLLALLEAARWAPSCFNDQPWRFIVCDKSRTDGSWDKAFSILAEKNQLWAKNAPLLILTVAMGSFNHNGSPNRWGSYDTGAAALSLCLQATALGLVSHQMGGFDAEKARTVFQLPDNCQAMSMMAVGYQAEAEILDESFQTAELADRSRGALSEKFYLGQWGQGIG
jgi:nitroreductase